MRFFVRAGRWQRGTEREGPEKKRGRGVEEGGSGDRRKAEWE